MSNTILLIDSNPAVQAIASLALSQLDINVQSLASKKNAPDKIREIKPDLVLYAHDDNQPEESFSLCSELKKDPELKDTAFILMVRAETAKAIAKEARAAGVTELLKKPFKSEQLRNTVERTLGFSSVSDSEHGEVLLILQDELTQKILRTLLKKREIGLNICESVSEALPMLEQKTFAATLFETGAIDNGGGFSWIVPDKMGSVFAVLQKEEAPDSIPDDSHIRVINRPLSFAKIQEALDFLIPDPAEGSSSHSSDPLEPEEQAILAARISASVFELLLNQQALRSRNWRSAGSLAKDELLRVCAQFDALAVRAKE